jgi:ATP phosphoribosyltransferase
MKKKLKIAIPKGRVLNDSLDILRKAGFIKHSNDDYNSRKLIFDYADDNAKLLIVKPWDVGTFVEYGAVDIGIAGKDILLENPKNVYEPLDLGFGKCKIAVAMKIPKHSHIVLYHTDYNKAINTAAERNKDNKEAIESPLFKSIIEEHKKRLYYLTNLRVATKYVHITEDFFKKKGLSIQIIKLYGNIELAPLSGLCEMIVDLVSTGETLRQNGLVEIDEIAAVTSMLIINRASLKTNPKGLRCAIESFNKVLNT